MITDHFWSVQSITIMITQKTVIDCNRECRVKILPCRITATWNSRSPYCHCCCQKRTMVKQCIELKIYGTKRVFMPCSMWWWTWTK